MTAVAKFDVDPPKEKSFCRKLQYCYTEIVGLLIGAGAAVNQPTSNGATTLYVAAHKGHVKIARLLIDGGTAVNQARVNSGATPLYIAAEKGHAEVVRMLIGGGAIPRYRGHSYEIGFLKPISKFVFGVFMLSNSPD